MIGACISKLTHMIPMQKCKFKKYWELIILFRKNVNNFIIFFNVFVFYNDQVIHMRWWMGMRSLCRKSDQWLDTMASLDTGGIPPGCAKNHHHLAPLAPHPHIKDQIVSLYIYKKYVKLNFRYVYIVCVHKH